MLLKDKYFHSIHSYIDTSYRHIMLDDIIDKMEKIFRCGFILPYKDIVRIYGNVISRNNYVTLNGSDYISISLHESNPQKIDIEYKEKISNCENAFQSFIIQEPSIVLEPNIAKDLKFLNYNGIYLERLVAEPVSLEYMSAISIFAPGMLEPFFNNIPETQYYNCFNDSSFRIITIEYLDKIIELIKKYGYDIPVVDICTGNSYKENEKYREYVKTLKRHYISRD